MTDHTDDQLTEVHPIPIAPPTWQGEHTTGTRDRFGGIAIRHSDGTTAYLQPGDDANDLGATLDACGDDLENIDGLLCDYLPD